MSKLKNCTDEYRTVPYRTVLIPFVSKTVELLSLYYITFTNVMKPDNVFHFTHGENMDFDIISQMLHLHSFSIK